jgi:addiction module HigA family antidote
MLESLKGDRNGRYSIRINDRFRVCFIGSEGDAFQVEIVDHHQKEMNQWTRVLTPIHPREIIKEYFLSPLQVSVNQLAKALDIDAARMNEIVRGRRGITADTTLSYRVISAHRPSSGCTFRAITNCRSRVRKR